MVSFLGVDTFLKKIYKFIALLIVFATLLTFCCVTNADAANYEDLVGRRAAIDKEKKDSEEELSRLEYLLLTLISANATIQNTTTEIPLILQTDYPDVPFAPGGRTVASSGCGVTCLTMLANYYFNEDYEPADLIPLFKPYIYGGTSGEAFDDSYDVMGLPIEDKTYHFQSAREALEDGKIVVAIMNADSIFTDGGHYIILTGINEQGLITINDPNGANYTRMGRKYETGFTDDEVSKGFGGGWIFSEKDFSVYCQALATKSYALSELYESGISQDIISRILKMSFSCSNLLN